MLVADAEEINSLLYFFQRVTWRALFMTISHHPQFSVSLILKPNMKKAPVLLFALLSFSTAIELQRLHLRRLVATILPSTEVLVRLPIIIRPRTSLSQVQSIWATRSEVFFSRHTIGVPIATRIIFLSGFSCLHQVPARI